MRGGDVVGARAQIILTATDADTRVTWPARALVLPGRDYPEVGIMCLKFWSLSAGTGVVGDTTSVDPLDSIGDGHSEQLEDQRPWSPQIGTHSHEGGARAG